MVWDILHRGNILGYQDSWGDDSDKISSQFYSCSRRFFHPKIPDIFLIPT